MRTLVAGGAGFIGSHLVDRLLVEGHDVDVVDDLSGGSLANLGEARAQRTGRLKIHQVDVRDPDVASLVVQRSPDVVYLLVRGDDADDVTSAERRLLGGVRILDAARRAGADKVVVTGSAALYGAPPAASLPVRESEIAAHDGASAVQMALLAYLNAYREAHGVEFTFLVLGSVYGPRQRHGVVAELVARAWTGEATTMHDDGGQTRDLVFVDDAVDALVRAAERGSGLVVNVGTGIETPIADLHRLVVEAVAAAGGPASNARKGGRSSQGRGLVRLALDPGRARIQLGWTPWTSLGEGLAHAVDAARP